MKGSILSVNPCVQLLFLSLRILATFSLFVLLFFKNTKGIYKYTPDNFNLLLNHDNKQNLKTRNLEKINRTLVHTHFFNSTHNCRYFLTVIRSLNTRSPREKEKKNNSHRFVYTQLSCTLNEIQQSFFT